MISRRQPAFGQRTASLPARATEEAPVRQFSPRRPIAGWGAWLRRALAPLLILAGLMLAGGTLAACQPNSPPSSPTRSTAPATPVPPTITVDIPTSPTTIPNSTSTPSPAPTIARPAPTATPPRLSNIVVALPSRSQLIQSPAQIVGRARVFEGTVSIELTIDGKPVGQKTVTASAGAPEWGSFATALTFDAPAVETPGIVRVFSLSARDGTVQDLIEVPVLVGPSGIAPTRGTPTLGASPAPLPTPTMFGQATPGTRRLVVYYPRESQSGVSFVAVNRDVPATAGIGRAALEALLAGPTAAELRDGLVSPIPPGSRLIGLRIAAGIAYADFDKQIQNGVGGSVRVMEIRRMIELTLQQFPTIENVVISVEGKTEEILQP